MTNDSPADDPAPVPSQPSDGHRERLRQRFLMGEADALADERLLELLLSYAIPRRDVRPLAAALLTRFGHRLAAVLAAEPTALARVPGVKEAAVTLLKLTHHLRGMSPAEAVMIPDEPAAEPMPAPVQEEPVLPPVPVAVIAAAAPVSPSDRKLQVSNGYSLEVAPLARLLSTVAEYPGTKKIPAAALVEGSGLSVRQVGNLVSIGAALGLIATRTQRLTAFGQAIARHDLFLENPVTLEFSHFLAAGNPRNLVWFEVFNDLLAPGSLPLSPAGWTAALRARFAGQYSAGSLAKHLTKEVRFVADAYTVHSLRHLGLLETGPDGTLTRRRGVPPPQSLTLAAMFTAFAARGGPANPGDGAAPRLVPFADLHAAPGSPGRLFGLDEGTLRPLIENLHERGWLRFETRHGLDQVRTVESLTTPEEFLLAAYERRAPRPGRPAVSLPPTPEDAPALLL